jgi:hypothetical protein
VGLSSGMMSFLKRVVLMKEQVRKSNVSYEAIKKNKTLMGFDEEEAE